MSKEKTLWDNAEWSLQNYQQYIAGQPVKFRLTLIDLLYISNFKGGNASVHEDENVVAKKLESYSTILKLIDKDFSGKLLVDLSPSETEQLTNYATEFCNLSTQSGTAISGFKSSFLSALLHAHFPILLPILDRRVLINAGIVTCRAQLHNSGQVKNISSHYKTLVQKFREHCIASKQTLRQLDKHYFIMPLPSWAKARPVKPKNDNDSGRQSLSQA